MLKMMTVNYILMLNGSNYLFPPQIISISVHFLTYSVLERGTASICCPPP